MNNRIIFNLSGNSGVGQAQRPACTGIAQAAPTVAECKFIAYFPNSKHFFVFCLLFGLFCGISASAQPKHQRYLDYIARYKQVALQYERELGIPASITLAQGLLESNAGSSYVATAGNNHFGIKCYHWKGEHVEWDDTLKHICYRKYGAPEDSFLDHAKFLKGPRYSILAQFDVMDYRSWAQGLRDCGYAEDANYPAKLIALIEQYELYAIDGGHRLSGAMPAIGRTAAQEQPAPKPQASASQCPVEQRPRAPIRNGKVQSSADND